MPGAVTPHWRLVAAAGEITIDAPGGLRLPLQSLAPRIVRYERPDRAETVWLIPRAPTGELALVCHQSEAGDAPTYTLEIGEKIPFTWPLPEAFAQELLMWVEAQYQQTHTRRTGSLRGGYGPKRIR